MSTRLLRNRYHEASELHSNEPPKHIETNSKLTELQTIIRKIYCKLLNDQQLNSFNSNHNEENGILLDLELDNIRCLLIRLQPSTPRKDATLSPREQEIARMVAKGYPNKTIAQILGISSWTVGTHLRRIFAKLDVCSRAAMVAQLWNDEVVNQ